MQDNPIFLPQITEEEIQKNNKAILEKLTPIVPAEAWTVRNHTQEPKIDEDIELMALRDIKTRPFQGVAARCNSISLPGNQILNLEKGDALFKKLVKDGFMDPLNLQLSKRGRKTCFFILTQNGLLKAGLNPETDGGRGGRTKKHQFIQPLIATKLREKNPIVEVEGEL